MRARNFGIAGNDERVKTFLAVVLTVFVGLGAGYLIANFNILYLIGLSLGVALLIVTLARPNWGVLVLIASTFALSLSFSQLTNYNVTPSDFLVIILGVGLFTSSATRRIPFRLSYVFLLLFLYLVVAFLSSLRGDVLNFYLPRLVQFSEFGFATFLFVQLRDVFNWKPILFVLTLGSSIISLYITYSTVFVTGFSKDIDALNTNSFAFLLDLTLPVAVSYCIMFFRDSLIKWLLPLTFLMLIGELASLSRGSYLGITCGLFLVIALSGLRSWLKIIPILAVIGLVVYLFVPDKAFINITDNKTFVDYRAYIWGLAFQFFLQNPIIGIGVAKLGQTFVAGPFGNLAQQDPHNFVLRLLVETGVIGLILVFGIIILALRRTYINFRAFKTQNRTVGWAALNLGMMGGLVAYLVHALFDVFWVRGSGLLFWLYIGLAYALAAKYLETKKETEILE